MKKLFSFFAAVLVAAAMMATELTFDFSAQGYENAQDFDGQTVDLGQGVSVSWSKGEGSTTPKYYNTGTAIRLYSSNSATFASTNGAITSIVCTYSGTSNTGTISANTGVYSLSEAIGTWTGSANSVILTNTATSGHARLKKVVITFSGNAIPSISCTAISFGTVLSGTDKEAAVTGVSLHEHISAAMANGGHFTLSADTLPAAGGKLTLTIAATAAGEYKDTLVLSSDTVVKYVPVVANVVVPEGAGTQEDPFTVADVILMANPGLKGVWAEGTIVGVYKNSKVLTTVGEADSTNIAIATDADTIPVAIPMGEIRNALNLVANPTLMGADVKVKGELIAYFSTTGVKNVSAYEIVHATALENKEAAMKAVKAVENGQLVIIREGKRYNALGTKL